MILRCGYFVLLLVFKVRCMTPEGCDGSLNGGFREGILGQVGMFPWLGVIRVKLYEGENIRIAMTGAILIKHKFALTIADDIARIPRVIFQRDTQALFIPNDGEPWLCRLKNYTTHPEYPAIVNTFALLELEFEDGGPAPLIPICWPPKSYNASNQMYVFGITDANDILEKEARRVQFVQPAKCKHWYKTEGLETAGDRRRQYKCTAALNSNTQCLYETGMVLASNATGPWILLGFGVYGPGCASPARFIEIQKYLPWIEAVTGKIKKAAALRMRAGGVPDVPIHQLFRTSDDHNATEIHVPWIFDRYESGLVPEISRLDQDAIVIFSSKYELEQGDCTKDSKLIYSDSFKMHADRLGGKAFYTLSLMDLSVFNYTCIIVRVEAAKKSKAKLWYNYGSFIDTLEGGDETPNKIPKRYPLPRRPTTKSARKLGKREVTNNGIHKNKMLVSDALMNNLTAIKNDLETFRKELNETGEADINKMSKKIFAIKKQLMDVRLKLGSLAPRSLMESIEILDKTGSELRAGKVYYQGHLVDVKQQELQKSIDLLNAFRIQTDLDIETSVKKPLLDAVKIAKAREGQKTKLWKPHELLEPEFITDKPGWWLYFPHLNLEIDFQWEDESEMVIEIYSHLKKTRPTRGPNDKKPTRTRNITTTVTTTTASSGGSKANDTGNKTEEAVKMGFDISKLPEGHTLPPGVDPKDLPENLIDILLGSITTAAKTTPSGRKRFLDSRFLTYAKLKRAEYDDLAVTRDPGFEVENVIASGVIKSQRLIVLIGFCLIFRRMLFIVF